MSVTSKRDIQLAQSISKAINAVETPVKEKHVRSTIIGTFHEKGAVTFWICVSRLHLQENRIEAWKFCHVLHKLMREGHYNCLEHSQRHVTMIEDLGKLWVHLKECYGKLIHTYCRFLITKIEFHRRNHRFPGNLLLTGEELDAIGENDINNYFQMSVEIFDYMDDVLALQAAIFDSINNTSSMTSAGQCRLAPILPCVQDSNQLYDFSVKLLFKLHSMLPSDTLAGHRDRFMKQFRILKKFYQKTDKMQYFKNLITIPRLPENPPNFLIQSELRTYIPPVVILPPEDIIEEQDIVGNLIDTSDLSSQVTSPDSSSDHVDFGQGHPSDPIVERDSLIDHLQMELGRNRNEIHSLLTGHRVTVETLNDRIASMERELSTVKVELDQERGQKLLLLEKYKNVESSPEEKRKIARSVKLQSAEDRLRSVEEKFQKLKIAYTQMRGEHITLIRQKADVDKQFLSLKRTTQELDAKIESLVSANERLNDERTKINDGLQSSDQETQKELGTVRQELDSVIIKHQQEKQELHNCLAKLEEELAKVKLDKDTQEKQKEVEIVKFQKEISSKEIMLEENHKLLKQLSDLKQQFSENVQRKNDTIKDLEVKNYNLTTMVSSLTDKQEVENNNYIKSMKELNEQIKKTESELQELNSVNESQNDKLFRLTNEKSELECDLQDLLQQTHAAEESVSYLADRVKTTEDALSKEKVNVIIAQWNMMRVSVQASEDIISAVIHELDNPAISSLQCGTEYLKSLLPTTKDTLDKLEECLLKYKNEKLPSFDAAKYMVLTTHLVGSNVIQGVATSNTSKDIVFGELMALECKELAQAMLKCISFVKSMENTASGEPQTNGDTESSDVEKYIEMLKKLLSNLSSLAEKVGGVEDCYSGDSVDGELANMDKAIEEAAIRMEEMMQKNRTAHSGLKLEVNEKILDACTNLMKAVRELVKKSKVLQGEIISQGRGTNTAKEFYKRNHQWTEGLISAAKSVGMGAKLLLTAADKVVSHDAKLEHVMVASQEIAASTAQLVVASRVRATRGSEKLIALTAASKEVSVATGAVIATSKTCAEMVEDSEELDMSGKSWQASKRMEMESRVRVIELEQALATERLKLAAVRRMQYNENADN